MWKIAAIILAILIAVVAGSAFYLADKIYLRDGHVAVSAEFQDTPLTPEAIREDLDILLDTLARNHPDFEAINGARYAEAVRALAATIDAPLTRLEVYRLVAPLNAHLLDGHTGLEPPDEERNRYEASGGRYIDFTARLEEGRVRIARVLADSAQYEVGQRIMAINGVRAEELAAHAMATRSGENEALRQSYAEARFYRDIMHMGIASPFVVDVEESDEAVRSIQSPGLTRGELIRRRAGQAGYAFSVLDGRTGLITFSAMPSELGQFRVFLRDAFAEIRQRGLSRLIIDLRENGGGDSRAGDALMRYLSPDALPSVARVDVKVTEDIRAYYRTLLPEGFRWIPLHAFVPMLQQIESTPAGQSFSLSPPPTEPRPQRQPVDAFDGELTVLIGPRTYSSAVIFAAPLQHYGRATFIGEETGEPMIFFGENYYFDLPNSRLQAVVSHKRFTLVGARDANSGIIPDIEADADDALRVAQSL